MNWRILVGLIFLAILLSTTFFIAYIQTPAVRVLPGDTKKQEEKEKGVELNKYDDDIIPNTGPFEDSTYRGLLGKAMANPRSKQVERLLLDASGNKVVVQFSSY